MKDILSNKNVLFTSIGFFLVFFGFGAAQQYLVPLLKLQGKEDLALISLLLLYSSFLITGIIAPKIIDRLGLKKSVLLGSTTYWIFTLGVITNSSPILFVASVLIGVGAALLWISSGQIIADSSTKHTLGRNLGFQFSTYLLGNLFGIAFGALLLDIVTFNQFYIYFSIAIFLSLPFFVGIKLTKQTIPDKKFKPFYIFDKKLLFLFPIIFAAYFLMAQAFASISLIILSLFGIAYVGILSTISRISGVISAFAIGKFSDMYKKENILYVLTLIGMTGVLLFIVTSEIVFVTLGVILLGLFISAAYPVCLSLLKRTVPEKEYIYALGGFHVYTTIAVLGALSSALYLSPKVSLLPGLIFLILSFPAVFLFGKKYSK